MCVFKTTMISLQQHHGYISKPGKYPRRSQHIQYKAKPAYYEPMTETKVVEFDSNLWNSHEIAYERILAWTTEGAYEVFGNMYR